LLIIHIFGDALQMICPHARSGTSHDSVCSVALDDIISCDVNYFELIWCATVSFRSHSIPARRTSRGSLIQAQCLTGPAPTQCEPDPPPVLWAIVEQMAALECSDIAVPPAAMARIVAEVSRREHDLGR